MVNLEDHVYNPEIFPISQDRGTGERFKVGDDEYIIVGDSDSDYPGYRVAFFDTTTWANSGCMTAEHYYGSMKIHTNNKSVINHNFISGYLDGYKVPKEAESLRVDILRPLTQREINRSPKRWEFCKAGSLTNAFYSEEDVINTFKECLPYLLKGKWIIKCNCLNNQNVILIDN